MKIGALALAATMFYVTASAQETHRFIISVASTQDVHAKGRVNMVINAGEVFEFVRFASTSEYTGAPQSSVDPPDQNYVVGSIGTLIIMAPTVDFRWVNDAANLAAERKYYAELLAYEETLKSEIAETKERMKYEQEQELIRELQTQNQILMEMSQPSEQEGPDPGFLMNQIQEVQGDLQDQQMQSSLNADH